MGYISFRIDPDHLLRITTDYFIHLAWIVHRATYWKKEKVWWRIYMFYSGVYLGDEDEQRGQSYSVCPPTIPLYLAPSPRFVFISHFFHLSCTVSLSLSFSSNLSLGAIHPRGGSVSFPHSWFLFTLSEHAVRPPRRVESQQRRVARSDQSDPIALQRKRPISWCGCFSHCSTYTTFALTDEPGLFTAYYQVRGR